MSIFSDVSFTRKTGKNLWKRMGFRLEACETNNFNNIIEFYISGLELAIKEL